MPSQITVANRTAHDVDLGGPMLRPGARTGVSDTPHVRRLIDAGVVSLVKQSQTPKRRRSRRRDTPVETPAETIDGTGATSRDTNNSNEE